MVAMMNAGEGRRKLCAQSCNVNGYSARYNLIFYFSLLYICQLVVGCQGYVSYVVMIVDYYFEAWKIKNTPRVIVNFFWLPPPLLIYTLQHIVIVYIKDRIKLPHTLTA